MDWSNHSQGIYMNVSDNNLWLAREILKQRDDLNTAQCSALKLGLITPTHLPSINFGTLLALNLKRLLVEIEICHCFQLVKDV